MPEDCDLLAVGEMGIANTTTAATLCTALLGGGAARWAGRGTGVDDEGLARKRAAIEAALEFHRGILGDPLAVAAAMGGRELAAIAGAVLAARQRRIAVLLDGFVATAGDPAARASGCGASSIIAAPGMCRPKPAIATAKRIQARSVARSRHAAGRSLRRRRCRSCCCARPWPATTEWQPSRKPAFPIATADKSCRLPRLIGQVIRYEWRDANGAHRGWSLQRCRTMRGDLAGACRHPHPRQPRRPGRPVPRIVRQGARIRRARGDRWALPVGLHAGADDGAGAIASA